MPDERFLRRWSRLKAQGAPDEAALPAKARPAAPEALAPLAQTSQHPPVAPPAAPAGAAPERPLPTLDDVAQLGADSDFSAFVTQGVDKTVQRLAMKKLFSDPHFNLMDGLDIYIDDYNKSDPIPAALLASLEHARNLFAGLAKDEEGADGKPGPRPPGQPDDDPPPQSSQGDA
ncbi:MAG: DUF3306 domain-containing protein [Massilia sp.]